MEFSCEFSSLYLQFSSTRHISPVSWPEDRNQIWQKYYARAVDADSQSPYLLYGTKETTFSVTEQMFQTKHWGISDVRNPVSTDRVKGNVPSSTRFDQTLHQQTSSIRQSTTKNRKYTRSGAQTPLCALLDCPLPS